MSDETYNGWKNYETWKLALNIDNEQGLYNEVLELVKDGCPDFSGDDLRGYLEEIFEYNDVGYKICDFWSYNEWREIYFDEIVDAKKEEIKEQEAYNRVERGE